MNKWLVVLGLLAVFLTSGCPEDTRTDENMQVPPNAVPTDDSTEGGE